MVVGGRATFLFDDHGAFITEFNVVTGNKTEYYPLALHAKIDAINERIYSNVNNGVYCVPMHSHCDI